MPRYCLALDLKDDPELIAEYENKHRSVSPYIKASIKKAGILNMIIYRTANRLFMIMETSETFSFEAKAAMDAADPLVQEWEALVLNYQQPLSHARNGEKWVLMDKIFELAEPENREVY
ncbi:MAG: L-rhamnose mutarotase [Chitinophagaceae bacterium]